MKTHRELDRKRAAAWFALAVLAGMPAVARAEGFLDAVDCAAGMKGWAAAPGDKDTAIDAVFTFDAAAGEPGVVLHPYVANLSREDLCADHGCDHGFVVTIPLSLYDGAEHTVHAYGAETGMGSGPELTGSPKTFTCPLVLPTGVKRAIADDASMGAWRFSPFWDEISVSDGILGAYAEGAALPAKPDVVHASTLPDAVLVLDVTATKAKVKRAFSDGPSLAAWDVSAAFSAEIDDAELAKIPAAAPMRARPFVLRGPGGVLFLVDDDPKAGSSGSASTGSNGEGGAREYDGPLTKGCGCEVALGASRSAGGVPVLLASAVIVLAIARLRVRARLART